MYVEGSRRTAAGSGMIMDIMHDTFNAVAGISNIMITPQNDLLIGGPGIADIIVLLLTSLVIYIYDRFISKDCLFSKEI